MDVWFPQNVHQDGTSHVTSRQPCNHWGGYSKMCCVKLQLLVPSHMQLELSGSAQKQRTVQYSCHCEALRARVKMRRLTSVHIHKFK